MSKKGVFQVLFPRQSRHRVLRRHFPVDDDAHPVADLLDERKDVRGQENGFALFFQFHQKVGHRFCRQNVQAVGRLVEDDEFGVVDEGDRDGDLLLHARRKIGDFRLRKLVDAEAGKEHFFALVPYLGGDILQFAEKIEGVVGGEKFVRFEFAGQKSDLRAHFVRLAHDGITVDFGVAFVRADEGGEHAERRRFARAVGAEKSVDLPFACRKRKPVYRDLFARCRLFDFPLFCRQTERLFEVCRHEHVLRLGRKGLCRAVPEFFERRCLLRFHKFSLYDFLTLG